MKAGARAIVALWIVAAILYVGIAACVPTIRDVQREVNAMKGIKP